MAGWNVLAKIRLSSVLAALAVMFAASAQAQQSSGPFWRDRDSLPGNCKLKWPQQPLANGSSSGRDWSLVAVGILGSLISPSYKDVVCEPDKVAAKRATAEMPLQLAPGSIRKPTSFVAGAP